MQKRLTEVLEVQKLQLIRKIKEEKKRRGVHMRLSLKSLSKHAQVFEH